MPVGFLSDEQVAAYGRFNGVPSRAELERFFFVDDADQQVVRSRRGDHNRLGFALQLGTVRFLGAFLPDPLDVPGVVLDYVADQLGVGDPSVVNRTGFGGGSDSTGEWINASTEEVSGGVA